MTRPSPSVTERAMAVTAMLADDPALAGLEGASTSLREGARAACAWLGLDGEAGHRLRLVRALTELVGRADSSTMQLSWPAAVSLGPLPPGLWRVVQGSALPWWPVRPPPPPFAVLTRGQQLPLLMELTSLLVYEAAHAASWAARLLGPDGAGHPKLREGLPPRLVPAVAWVALVVHHDHGVLEALAVHWPAALSVPLVRAARFFMQHSLCGQNEARERLLQELSGLG